MILIYTYVYLIVAGQVGEGGFNPTNCEREGGLWSIRKMTIKDKQLRCSKTRLCGSCLNSLDWVLHSHHTKVFNLFNPNWRCTENSSSIVWTLHLLRFFHVFHSILFRVFNGIHVYFLWGRHYRLIRANI